MLCATRATLTAPSPTSTRPFASIPMRPQPCTIARWCGATRTASRRRQTLRPRTSRELAGSDKAGRHLPVRSKQRFDLLNGKIDLQIEIDLAELRRGILRMTAHAILGIRERNLVLADPLTLRFEIE